MSAGSATRLPEAYAATLFPSTLAINGSPVEVITPVIFRGYFVPLRTCYSWVRTSGGAKGRKRSTLM